MRRWVLVAAPLLLLAACEGVLRLAGAGHDLSFVLRGYTDGKAIVHDNVYFGLICFPRQLARQTPHFVVTSDAPSKRVVVLGESAAMGDPMPEFGLARQLQVLLRNGTRRVDVVNAGMTAIDSHVIRRIAADLKPLRPDVVVLYAGNNELIGPFGPGRLFLSKPPSPALAQFTMALRSTRVGQCIARAVESVRGTGASSSRWRGLALFDERRYAEDDPATIAARAHFEANVRDTIRLAQQAGARVCLVTMAVNLHMAPFASTQDTKIGDPGIASHIAGQLQIRGRRAPRADPGNADSHYRLALTLQAGGRADEARAAFALARDLDTLRVRADSREVAATRALRGRADALVDAAAELSDDPALFLDHVHLSFDGNFRLARQVADRVAALLGSGPPAAMTRDDVARALAFTPVDEAQMIEKIGQRLVHPPFTGQSDHAERLLALRDRLRALRAQRVSTADRLAALDDALSLAPDDAELLVRRGFVLEAMDRTAEALASYRRALDAVPQHTPAHLALGRLYTLEGDVEQGLAHYRLGSPLAANPAAEALAAAGATLADTDRRGEAEQLLRRACAADPRHTIAHYNLALLCARSGREDEALQQYERTIHLDPAFDEARNNAAVLLMKRHRTAEAIEQLQRAVEDDPDYVSAWRNLAAASADAGRRGDAIDALRHVLRLAPDDQDARRALGELVE